MIFTEEQELFRASVREFAETELAPATPEILRTNVLPDWLYAKAAELGLTGVNIPEEDGGVGLGQVETCIVFEELARVCPGFGLSLEQSLDNNCILRQKDSLQEKYLSAVADGSVRVASCATPPCGQANGTEHEVMFKKVDGGYVANGVRLYASNCDGEIGFVMGLDEDRRVLACWFEKGWDGIEQGPLDVKLGMAGSHGGTVVFRDAFIPEENVTVSEYGTSTTYYMVYDCCPAEALGTAKGLFDKTLAFIENRTHDGKPLMDFTAIHYGFAEIQSKIMMCESMIYDCAQYEDEYERTQDPQIGEKWFMLAESVKMRASEMLCDVCYDLIKLTGGMGYHDPNYWHFMGDALNFCIMDQTTEIHLGALARLMGLVK